MNPAGGPRWLLPILILALAAPAAGGTPSRAERRIGAAVDRDTPAARDLLVRAVNLNSGTMNFAGVRAVGRLFQPEFESLGFAVEWRDGSAWGRAGHLVARRLGRAGAPRVLLIGHLDTVFEPESPFQRYEALSDTTARGPGVIDMKGGDVVMLLALRALAAAGALDGLTVRVVLTGDEEKSGAPLELARRDLLAAAESSQVAIGFEDGDGDPRTAVIARRGASGWRLRAAGLPAHSSQIFREDIGSGSIYEAARVLAAFRDSLAGKLLLTANPAVILGGTTISYRPEESRGSAFGKTNVIAESTTVVGDLRTISLEQRERAKAVMQAIVAAHLPRTTGEIVFEDGYPPLAPTEGNRRLLSLFDTVSRDLGFGPVTVEDPARAGAADISFTGGLVGMALDGVGLMGDGGHTVAETADLRTLPMQAKRVAVTLARLAARGR
jgi:glutamate carboxypeptidase